MPDILAPFIEAAFAIDAAATALTIGGVSITAGALVTAGLTVGIGVISVGIGPLQLPKLFGKEQF